MSLASTVSFIANHPNSRGRRLRNLSRFAAWQLRCRFSDKPMRFSFINGSKLYAVRGLHGATGNLYVGLHEFEEMSFAAHFLRPGDLFCDVGANVGSYTILAAAGIGANVIAFEPNPDALEWLLKNVALNAVEKLVDAHRIVVSSQPGRLRFTSSLGTTNRVSNDGDTVVEADTLDRVLPRAPSLIKMDVEGHEPEVLAGAERTLSAAALQAIIAELNAAQTVHLLASHGFAPHRYDPILRRLLPASNASRNGIFVRDATAVERRLQAAPKFHTLTHVL